MDVDVESRVRAGTQGCSCGRGEGASARSKHSTQGNRRLSSTDLQSLGTRGSAGTLWNGGAGANAGTNSSRLVILGGGGRLGAGGQGGRELGRELGSFTRGGPGQAGLGLGLGLGLEVATVGTIPTMGRFRWSQRLLQLFLCVLLEAVPVPTVKSRPEIPIDT